MLSDDVFRAKRNLTIAELGAWTGFVADVAHVEHGNIEGAWRICMTPRASSACPVELLIRDDQKFDIRIGREVYEDLPIITLDDFRPLLEAIVDGRVITRTTMSALTGAERDVETFVTTASGQIFHGHASLANGSAAPPPLPSELTGVEVRDTHYVPYRRVGR